MSFAQRYALAAVGLLCLTAVRPLPAAAQQRGSGPGAATPRLLVATFRTSGTDARIGVDGADALRARVQRDNRAEDLWVIPRSQMNALLVQSGFGADSVLSLDDLKLLAQSVRADAIVDGEVVKTATGVAVHARLVLPSNLGLVQPLPVVEAPSVADAAKVLERHLEEAQKSLLDFRRCANAISAQNYDEAQRAAQSGIVRYPGSTLSRLCLMDAYAREQQPLDSIIHAADAVLRIDSTSVLALMNLVSAYRDKHDTLNTIGALRRLVVYRPDLRPELVRTLAQANRPQQALQIVADQLRESPREPALLKQRWLLLLAAHQWQEALRAGDELVAADPAAATSDYYTRSIAAALSDSQPVLAVAIGRRAVAALPNDASLWLLKAQAERKAGEGTDALASARRALTLDGTLPGAWPLTVTLEVELQQPDSAINSSRLALAGGADSATIRRLLVVPLATAAKHADESKSRAAWLEVLRLAARVDSVLPSPDEKYYIALSSFEVGFDALQSINTTRKCSEAELAEQMWATASIAAPLGARAGDAQKQGAAQIMTAIEQNSATITQAKKAFCKKPRRTGDAG